MKTYLNEINRIKTLMGLTEESTPNVLYHGTIYDFDTFDLTHSGSGDGNDLHGYGVNLSNNKEVAIHYANELGFNKHKIIYTVRLINNPEIINWEETIDGYLAEEILNNYQKYTNNDEDIYDLKDNLGLSEDYYGDHPLMHQIYNHLTALFDSKKTTSEFLSKCGLDGVKYYSKENGIDGINYLIFDTNNIRIIDKEYL